MELYYSSFWNKRRSDVNISWIITTWKTIAMQENVLQL